MNKQTKLVEREAVFIFDVYLYYEFIIFICICGFQVDPDKLTIINGVKPVSPEQEELIHRLVYFQNEYEQPSEEDLKRIEVSAF